MQHTSDRLQIEIKDVVDKATAAFAEVDKAIEIIDGFITKGKERESEPQVLVGCMLKAQLRALARLNQTTSKQDISERLLIAAGMAQYAHPGNAAIDPLAVMNDPAGVFLVIEDSFRKKYGKIGENLAAGLMMVFLRFPDEQKLLMQEMAAHHIQPFQDIHVAFVGGEKEIADELPLKTTFGAFREFNKKNPLSLKNSISENQRYDYVVTGNVLTDREAIRNARALCSIACASANLVKKGGKVFHITSYGGNCDFLSLLLKQDVTKTGQQNQENKDGVIFQKASKLEQIKDERLGLSIIGFRKLESGVISKEGVDKICAAQAPPRRSPFNDLLITMAEIRARMHRESNRCEYPCLSRAGRGEPRLTL